jgi:hypothetical protein
MTTSSVSVASVFVVLLATGRYDDWSQRVVRTFTKREDAERFTSRKNDAINHVRGMCDAVSRLMKEWEKVNPAPPSRYGEGNEDWSEEADEAYRQLQCAEEDRLSAIIGIDAEWEALKLDRYDGRDAYYSYVESKIDGSAYSDDE